MKKFESFLLGLLAAIFALVIELIFTSFFPFSEEVGGLEIFGINIIFIGMLTLLAFIEESSKYLLIAKKIENFSHGKSVIVNSLFLGFGFSFVDIILFRSNYASPQSLLHIPILEVILLHALTAGIIGYFIGVASSSKKIFLRVIPLVVILHLSYNLFIIHSNEITTPLKYAFLLILLLINIANLARIEAKLAS